MHGTMAHICKYYRHSMTKKINYYKNRNRKTSAKIIQPRLSVSHSHRYSEKKHVILEVLCFLDARAEWGMKSWKPHSSPIHRSLLAVKGAVTVSCLLSVIWFNSVKMTLPMNGHFSPASYSPFSTRANTDTCVPSPASHPLAYTLSAMWYPLGCV